MLNLQDQTHLCHVKVTTEPNLFVAKLSSKCVDRDTEKHYLIKFLVDLKIFELKSFREKDYQNIQPLLFLQGQATHNIPHFLVEVEFLGGLICFCG